MLAFFVKEENCRSCAQERVVEGLGRILLCGFLDEVGAFQRAGRRVVKLGWIAYFFLK